MPAGVRRKRCLVTGKRPTHKRRGKNRRKRNGR